MRRIYESSALDRDDADPFRPNERDERTRPRAARTVPAAALSRALVPERLRHRAISLQVTTPRQSYTRGRAVPVEIRMKNALPFPVSIATISPLLWTWHVDGLREASHVAPEEPAEPGEFTFDRGERKLFRRNWPQTFQVSDSEWEDAAPGEYTIGAGLNVENPEQKGVYDETTVRIE